MVDYCTDAVPTAGRYPEPPGLVNPQVAPQLNRARYIELTTLAMETVQWLEAKGLKIGEQCEFRQLCERLWFAKPLVTERRAR